jgi:hypothetical protein
MGGNDVKPNIDTNLCAGKKQSTASSWALGAKQAVERDLAMRGLSFFAPKNLFNTHIILNLQNA